MTSFFQLVDFRKQTTTSPRPLSFGCPSGPRPLTAALISFSVIWNAVCMLTVETNSSCTDLAAVTFQIQDVVKGHGGVEMNHVTVDSGEHVTPVAEYTLRTHSDLFHTLFLCCLH